ncbi:MAG: response regulator [Lachnospiraceae bacterium]
MKVLLVDDEPIELDMLEKSVNWSELGICQVRRASNGKRAYQMITKDLPDILITDIEMPVMDGFELARKIVREKLPIVIIFLTGYDKFSYIQVAFSLDVVDYVLKPIEPLQIKYVVMRAVKRAEYNRKLRNSLGLTKRIAMEKIILGEGTEELCSQFDDEVVNYYLLAVNACWEKKFYNSLFERMPSLQYGAYRHNCCFFLISEQFDPEQEGKNLLKLAGKICAESANLVYDGKSKSVREISQISPNLKQWIAWLYSKDYDTVFPVSQFVDSGEQKKTGTWLYIDKLEFTEEFKSLCDRMTGDDAEAVELAVKQLVRYLWNRSGEQIGFSELLKACVMCLEKYYVEGNQLLQQFMTVKGGAAVEEIVNAGHIQRAEALFREYVLQFFAFFQIQKGGKYTYVVHQVKDYIHQNYQNGISMEELSGNLRLSVNYIRKIFKEEMGMTLLDYVTEYRFSQACQLLKNRRLRIEEVSRMVGYENTSYFNSVFKRRYGMTPGEYRNTIGC